MNSKVRFGSFWSAKEANSGDISQRLRIVSSPDIPTVVQGASMGIAFIGIRHQSTTTNHHNDNGPHKQNTLPGDPTRRALSDHDSTDDNSEAAVAIAHGPPGRFEPALLQHCRVGWIRARYRSERPSSIPWPSPRL